MFNSLRWLNQRVFVLCGKHKRRIGKIVHVVAKVDFTRFVVCFEQLAPVKVNTNCAVLTLDKLKKLSLN
ncbi:50S ribosomal protein L24 [Candidatus Hodgkinia cicadicola]|nr:50S ribosomal protein L24 [Candidatus Hodgkinia cicadicola]